MGEVVVAWVVVVVGAVCWLGGRRRGVWLWG